MIREKDYLMHYGVKGMKWGVRKKYYNSDGSVNRLGYYKTYRKHAQKNFLKAKAEFENYAKWHPRIDLRGRKNPKFEELLEEAQYQKAYLDAIDRAYRAEKKKYRADKKKYIEEQEARQALYKEGKIPSIGDSLRFNWTIKR